MSNPTKKKRLDAEATTAAPAVAAVVPSAAVVSGVFGLSPTALAREIHAQGPAYQRRVLTYLESLSSKLHRRDQADRICSHCKLSEAVRRQNDRNATTVPCRCRRQLFCSACHPLVSACEMCLSAFCDECEEDTCDTCYYKLCKACVTKRPCGRVACEDCLREFDCADCDYCMGYV